MIVYRKDRPVGNRGLRASKILLTMCGIARWRRQFLQGKYGLKTSLIELET